jgi:hypothetical protein
MERDLSGRILLATAGIGLTGVVLALSGCESPGWVSGDEVSTFINKQAGINSILQDPKYVKTYINAIDPGETIKVTNIHNPKSFLVVRKNDSIAGLNFSTKTGKTTYTYTFNKSGIDWNISVGYKENDDRSFRNAGTNIYTTKGGLDTKSFLALKKNTSAFFKSFSA